MESVDTKPDAVADADAAKLKILAAYKQLLTFQFVGTTTLVVSMSIYLLICYSKSLPMPLMLLALLAGILGAFFSALTRLYHVDEAGVALITPTVQLLGGPYLLIYSFVPPIVGAIAAIVLYLIFVSGYMDGGLFPHFACTQKDDCKTVLELMNFYWPATAQDYGKVLVWSFVAGFSERFVPDLLQSMIAKQHEVDKKARQT